MLKFILALVLLVKLCYSICDANCNNCNQDNNTCNICVNKKVIYDGSCLDTCPPGYYQNDALICQKCNPLCKTCQSSKDNCTSCPQTAQFLYQGNCLQSCIPNTIPTYDPNQSYCADCNKKCKTCQANPNNCSSCSDSSQSLYLGTCISICPVGTYSQQISSPSGNYNQCVQCIDNCQTCSSTSKCILCQPGFYLTSDGTQCVQQCPSGFLNDNIYRKCYRTSCPEGMFDLTTLNTNQIGVQCATTCPSGFYIDSDKNKCIQCDSACQECTGPGAANCLVCHETCLTCAGAGFDQCLSCTQDRIFYQKFNQPVGECVCNYDTTEELQQYCENSDQASSIKKALAGLTITNFVMGILNSLFTRNSIIILRYIDFSQTLSYLGYITFKYPVQMDRTLKIYEYFNIGYLLPQPNHFADPILISSQQLQNNPYNSQLAYQGNPLFFVNKRVPFLIINCFSYFMILLICLFFILALRFIVYPITKSDRVLKLSIKLPHTLLINLFIITSQEMITDTFIQYTNVEYQSEHAISIVSTIMAGVFTVIISIGLIYLIYRTKRKLDLDLEIDIFDAKSKYVRQIKEQNGIPSHFQLVILMRKIIYSIAIAFLYKYPQVQASIILIIQCLLLVYFFMKKPFLQSKFQYLATFIELSFTLFCLIMFICSFLSGTNLINAIVVFGAFLIIFQIVICILGSYNFFLITFKLLKIQEQIEIQELHKQYDAVKKLEYQNKVNQKQINNIFINQSNIQHDNDNNSPTKLLRKTQTISQENGFQAIVFSQSNIPNNNNNSYLLGGNTSYIQTRSNLHNESQILQNQTILETKTIDQQLSPIKGLQLGYLSYSNNPEHEQSPIKKTQMRKLLPPLNQSEQKTSNTSNILIDLSIPNSTTFKKSSIILNPVQQNNSTNNKKNGEYIKKRVAHLQNLEISSPNNEQTQKNQQHILEINSFIVNNAPPDSSKVQVTARENENASYRNNQVSNNVSSRSETIILQQQQKNQQNLQLIQDGEDSDEMNSDNNNGQMKNSQQQKQHFLQAVYQKQQKNPKEITILS
ncbi:hypothetical protein ABPG72_008982 [Tetrahymena utriculariae]